MFGEIPKPGEIKLNSYTIKALTNVSAAVLDVSDFLEVYKEQNPENSENDLHSFLGKVPEEWSFTFEEEKFKNDEGRVNVVFSFDGHPTNLNIISHNATLHSLNPSFIAMNSLKGD